MGFRAASASARAVAVEVQAGTATAETVRRHTTRAHVADAVSQVTGTALSVTMLCCYLPLVIFSTVWFVLGNYWFWRYVREDSCDQVVYNVSWWTMVYTVVMLLLGCVAGPGAGPGPGLGGPAGDADDGEGEGEGGGVGGGEGTYSSLPAGGGVRSGGKSGKAS